MAPRKSGAAAPRGARTALGSGASRGIGRAIAARLARDGYEVIAAARSAKELRALASEITNGGGRCQAVVMDVADPRSIAAALAGVQADVLVNNAGVATMKPFLELTPEEWQTMMDVNVNALYHVTRQLLPSMVKRGAGHIVTIGSIAGRNTFVGGSCYAATKHAVLGWSESLMLEVRDKGVRVSVIMPGSVATDLFPAGTDTTRMMQPEDVADAVAHVLAAAPRVNVNRVELRPSRPNP
ncbi:MAG: SDR family oxidoreductase [Gemmatimonadaceae bacterium]